MWKNKVICNIAILLLDIKFIETKGYVANKKKKLIIDTEEIHK